MLCISNITTDQVISGVSTEELNLLHELSLFLHEQDQVNLWNGLRKTDESCLQQLLNDNDVDLDLIIPEIDQNFEIPDLNESSGSTQLLRR